MREMKDVLQGVCERNNLAYISVESNGKEIAKFTPNNMKKATQDDIFGAKNALRASELRNEMLGIVVVSEQYLAYESEIQKKQDEFSQIKEKYKRDIAFLSENRNAMRYAYNSGIRQVIQINGEWRDVETQIPITDFQTLEQAIENNASLQLSIDFVKETNDE